ncbi:MAG: hypothetical protein ACTTHL_04645 [Oribacterium sp.]
MCKRILKSVLCLFTSAFLAVSPCISAYAAGEEVAGAVAEAMGAAGYVPWNNLLSGILTGLGISAEAQIGVLLESASYKAEQSKLVNTEEFKAIEKAKLFTAKTISPQTMTAGMYYITKESFADPREGFDALLSRQNIRGQKLVSANLTFQKLISYLGANEVVSSIYLEFFSDNPFIEFYALDSAAFPSFPVEFSRSLNSSIFFNSKGYRIKGKYFYSNFVFSDFETFSLNDPIRTGISYNRVNLFNFSSAKPFTWSVTDNLPRFKTVDGYTSVELPSWAGQPETVPAGQVAEGQEAYPVSIPALNGISDKVEDLAKALQGLTQAQAQAGTIPDSLKDVITNLKDVTKAVEDANTKAINLDILNFLKEMLQKILDGILAIPAAVIALPKSIADALKVPLDAVSTKVTDVAEAVKAVPKAITDFFTIDSAAVGAASAALSAEFKLHFALLEQLNFFKQTRSFDTAVPVIKMQIPAFWAFAFPGQSEIIIMDLRPYADIFRFARGILSAALWIAVAKWLLDQLDVEFHVG